MPARGSPWLFAACHVFHRLLMPRHPPNALLILTCYTYTATIHTSHVQRYSVEKMQHPRISLSFYSFFSLSVCQASAPLSLQNPSQYPCQTSVSLNGSSTGQTNPETNSTQKVHQPIHSDKDQTSLTQKNIPRSKLKTLFITMLSPLKWWRRTGSNRQPPACKAGALPTELRPPKSIPDLSTQK